MDIHHFHGQGWTVVWRDDQRFGIKENTGKLLTGRFWQIIHGWLS